MKKAFLYIFLISTFQLFSQVTTSPVVPTSNDEITITFDTTNTGLNGYTGDIYAHTGLITAKSSSDSDWKNVIGTWGVNTSQPKLTKKEENLYELTITPNIFTFYNISTEEEIKKIALVFRSSDGKQQTSPDIFISIFEANELNVLFTSPNNNDVFNLNDTITISAEASENADLELFINNESIKNSTSDTTISSTFTLTNSGTYKIKVTANNGTSLIENEIEIFVKSPTQNATQPTNLKYGVNINSNNSVTFLLKAPNKNAVFLIGDFSNWEIDENYQLFKDGEDFWLTVSSLDINTEYAYQYLIDYNIKVADPYSEKILDPWTDQYIKNGNYPNLKNYPTNLTEGYVSTFIINDTNYNWEINDFARPAQDNLIIYEMHIRDFVESDAYTETLTKLDYLESLGINAIELMPINEFEGADSWGYNPALYFALDKAYGTKNKFKEFVDECHKRGIAVIADVVFNHSYGQSPLVQMYWNNIDNKPANDNPWYNENHNFVDNTSAHWGYDFNHESTYTVNFFNDVLTYWITEYKIDGFRFDFTKGFSNTQWTGSNNWASSYDASRISILKNYADHVWSHDISNKPYVIFEHLSDNTEETELANYGIMLWGNINHNYNENTMGWAGSTDINWISYKQRGWNNPNLVGYMESHDEERLMYKNLQYGNDSNSNHNVKDLNIALSRQELAGMFFFTIPGPKMIWQFGELGYDFSINTCDNGTTVSNDCRLARKPIRWDYQNNANRKHIYSTWQTLIEFKKQQPVFNSNDFSLNVAGLTKTITLKDATMDVVLVGNFDVIEKTITTSFSKSGTWYEYFSGVENDFSSTSQNLTLKPGEYRLYSTVKLLDPRGETAFDDSDNDGVINTNDLCPNTMEGASVNATGCPIFSLPNNNFTVEVIGETCPNKNNGQIKIKALQNLNYSTFVNGTTYSFTNEQDIENLSPGTYTLCIQVDSENYEQCYTINVEEADEISAKVSLNSKTANIEISKGTPPFKILINNKLQFQSYLKSFNIELNNNDVIEIKSAISCEGVYLKKIQLNDNIVAYPNPTQGAFEIILPEVKNEVLIEIYNIQSQLISSKIYPVLYGKVQLNLENNPTGLYFAKVYLEDTKLLKIVKQ
ncbi:alpha-amylase family glycosyl hydrolase [uncultured Lutibacter sp.]|uniref:alpha-amylase family glycosyl hydrolase n=1 Tax=uncultured Lutibacter sp. TaxID=437739 RepID=UPI00261A5243|nr:alpha-amylase family glycosyl hydrolase [uncultured Lutibacter sp.]